MKLSELLYRAEHQTGALINIDAIHPAFYSGDLLDLAPEQHVHRGGFCEFAKRHSRESSLPCALNKQRSRHIAANGRVFSGTCPYGIWELAHPVMVADEHIATLYFGHFGSSALKRSIGTGLYNGTSPRPAPGNTQKLRASAAFISEFIRIEIEMWVSSGKSMGKQKPGNFYRDFCAQYIEANYRENIQLTDLANALKMTPNYVSTRIQRECGKTFNQLLNEKRLEVARTYLEFETEKSITDIAYMCGFRDSNYFSTVFRKHSGRSPRSYRNAR